MDLRGNTLSPMDCLVVGYFLSCVCLTTTGEFKVNLTNCSLDDCRVSFLVRELSQCSSLTDAQTTTGDGVPGCLALDLRRNDKLSGIGSLLQVMNVVTIMDLSGEARTFLTKVNCSAHLKLTGNRLSDDDIVHICNTLKTNTTLKGMSAAWCNITEKGCKAIGDALMVNTSLQVLDLSGNSILAGVVHIAESLKHNHSLLEINVVRCGITEKGCKAMGYALMENRSLQVLNLSGNPISDRVAVHIAKSLKHNDSLREINLGNCGITEKGFRGIGDALMVNRSLQVLDLSGNPISEGAVVHIAESVKHNHSLLEINFGRCGITAEGVKAITDALMVNRSLQVLDLSGNPISAGVVHIAEFLTHNHSLLKMNLSECGDLSDVGAAQIADGLQRNTSLKILDVSECGLKLDNCGLKSLGSALELNCSLEELDLTWNDAVTGVGLLALGESLKRNRGLKTLRLYGRLHPTFDNDWKQFIVCLQGNNYLTKLQLPSYSSREAVRPEMAVRQELTTLNDIRGKKNLPPLKFGD